MNQQTTRPQRCFCQYCAGRTPNFEARFLHKLSELRREIVLGVPRRLSSGVNTGHPVRQAIMKTAISRLTSTGVPNAVPAGDRRLPARTSRVSVRRPMSSSATKVTTSRRLARSLQNWRGPEWLSSMSAAGVFTCFLIAATIAVANALDTTTIAALRNCIPTMQCHLNFAEGCHLYIAATLAIRIRYIMEYLYSITGSDS